MRNSALLKSASLQGCMMELVEDAIIIAAGKGRRMLPANLITPKEFLPLIDLPAIMHLLWEAKLAGVTKVHLVLSQEKKNLFSLAMESNIKLLEEKPRVDFSEEFLDLRVEGLEIITHVQKNQNGVAGAILAALNSVRGAFLVMLGDSVMVDSDSSNTITSSKMGSLASLELVKKFNRTGVANAGYVVVSEDQVSNYGVVCLEGDKIESIVEKPGLGQIASNMILCGRYIMPKEFSKIYEDVEDPIIEEQRMISILNYLINNGGLRGVNLDKFQFYDCGNPIIWLKSQVDHAMRRSEYKDDFTEWIKNRISE